MDIFHKLDSYPEFLTTNHLCELGIYTSYDACYTSRKQGNSPDYIKMARRVLYPKQSVIRFLQRRLNQVDRSCNNQKNHGYQGECNEDKTHSPST